MKRIGLFVLTNLAVMLVLSVVTRLLGADRYMHGQGLDPSKLLVFCAVFGFGGALVSLLLSKRMALLTTGARVLDGTEGNLEHDLVAMVEQLAQRAGIRTPTVAIYEGAPNAFATGAFRDGALVAVSTGLLHTMDRGQVQAVLAHEIAHVANGDMQTLGLMQGVVNTFVMFCARVVGNVVDRVVFRNTSNSPGIGHALVVMVLELVFGMLASLLVLAFSRHREYRADWGAAELLGSAVPMQRALKGLAGEQSGLPKALAALGISGTRKGWLGWMRSHPPLEDRINALNRFGR